MQRFPANERVFLSGCALVLELTRDASRDNNEHREATDTLMIEPWSTSALVHLLVSATTRQFVDSLAFGAICEAAHDVLQCVCSAPHLSDIDGTGASHTRRAEGHLDTWTWLTCTNTFNVCSCTHACIGSLLPRTSNQQALRLTVRSAYSALVQHGSVERLDANPALQRALQRAAQ